MRGAAARAVLATLAFAGVAHAGPNDVVALPSAASHAAVAEPQVEALLPRLDQLVTEAVQDLGLTLSLEPRGPRVVPSDAQLLKRAKDNWVVLPTLESEASGLRLRIVAIRPGTRLMLTRSERSTPEDLDVRVAVMMRDLLQGKPEVAPPVPQTTPAAVAEPHEPRSSGRAVLALNSAVFGGYLGYSIQHASGSSDERLVYPLVALGTGVGLGASMLIADEWDVSVGGAWFLAAGLWWPTASGLLFAAHRDVAREDRFFYGVALGTGGIALATAAMTLTDITDGDAALTQSGGALGMGLGGLTQLFIDGRTRPTPSGGMAYGGVAGVLTAGVLATQIDPRPGHVLLVDLGATLGALTGAAAGSPLLLVDEQESKPRTRAWVGSIFAGTLLGAGIGYWAARNSAARTPQATLGLPYAIATPEARGARLEAGLLGRF